MSVHQVWKRKTPLPKSSPTCHNDSPPPQPPSRNTTHSISPPMNYPQRDRIIDQLHTISSLIDSQTSTPSSPPYPMVQPPTNAQVGCHASFCHCCRELVDIVKSQVEYSGSGVGTKRLTGHDQTKINVMQIFHVVTNKVNVDYASLLWWDFIHCVQQKRNVIQYPRFTKLIITDIMEKYESIYKRLEEDYHIIKNDTPDYEEKYGGVEVPMIQQEQVESTQGMHRTPRATRTPNTEDVQKKKRKGNKSISQDWFKKPKSTSTTPLPLIEERLLEEDIEKLVDGEDDLDGTKFADTVLLSDEDSGDRIEPESHKENPKKIDDDDDGRKDDKKDDDDNDDDDQDDHALIRT
ncbi:hypothetical protein Tco_0701587 [Tanacetum coccineum]